MHQRSRERVDSSVRWVAIASTLCLALALTGCDSSSPTQPRTPTPPPATATPAPTPTAVATSQYAGSWRFSIWLTAVDTRCGRTEADIDVRTGPIAVTVAGNGSFTVPDPVNASGTIDSAGEIRISFAESPSCPAGSGAGGCVNLNHCDGTSVRAGDVSKWTLDRS